MKNFLTSLLFLICSTLYADWSVKGEFLYLQPMIDQSYFAQGGNFPTTVFPLGTRFDNPFNFNPAYRLSAGYSWCENNFLIIWTHLPTAQHSRSVSGNIYANMGTPAGGNFNFANSVISLEYYALDALLGFKFFSTPKWTSLFRTGLHFAHFNFDETYIFRGTIEQDNAQNISKTWGIGPELAFELDFALYKCFLLTGQTKGALLVHHYNSRYTRLLNASTPFLSDEEQRWDVIPMLEFRLGIKSKFNWKKCPLVVEGGYMVLSYRDAINRINFNEPASPGLSTDLYSKINFHGPYIALNLFF